MTNQLWTELNDQQAQNLSGGCAAECTTIEFRAPRGIAKKLPEDSPELDEYALAYANGELPPGYYQGQKKGWVTGGAIFCD